LYRIDVRSREIVRIDLGSDRIETPDGLFLWDSTLYVAQNSPGTIAALKMSAEFTKARLDHVISDPTFAFPTSVARYRGKLLVVSSQFDTKGSPAAVSGDQPPKVPFWMSEIMDSTEDRRAARELD